MLILYMAPGSSSMATHIALNEVGAPFERRLVSFAAREQRGADYLRVNPAGKVPALVLEDGRVLTEVAATLWYLARRHPEAGLLPGADIGKEAQIISWMSFIASTIHPARQQGVSRWREVFELAEQRLGGMPWAVGGYSIADIHLFRLFWRFVDSLHPAPAEYPGLSAHYERMMARPAVRQTIETEQSIGFVFAHAPPTPGL